MSLLPFVSELKTLLLFFSSLILEVACGAESVFHGKQANELRKHI
jgi:hypothetical protein